MALKLESLPEELLSQVLSLVDHQSLYSVCLVSSRFGRLATPPLYRHVILRYDTSRSKFVHCALFLGYAMLKREYVSYASTVSIVPIHGWDFEHVKRPSEEDFTTDGPFPAHGAAPLERYNSGSPISSNDQVPAHSSGSRTGEFNFNSPPQRASQSGNAGRIYVNGGRASRKSSVPAKEKAIYLGQELPIDELMGKRLIESSSKPGIADSDDSINIRRYLFGINFLPGAQVLPLTLSRFSNLRRLEISCLSEPEFLEMTVLDAAEGRKDPNGNIAFSHLEDVTIDQTHWLESCSELFRAFFKLPSVKRIRGIRISGGMRRPINLLQADSSSVEVIDMEFCSKLSQLVELPEIIKACKKLRSFTYRTFTGPLHPPTELGSFFFQKLEPALKQHSKWLENLSFYDHSCEVRFNRTSAAYRQQKINLREFEAMKHLEIPWPVLVDGFASNELTELEPICEDHLKVVFPSNIETLHISSFGIMPLSSCLERALYDRNSVPLLKHLTIENLKPCSSAVEALHSLVTVANSLDIRVEILGTNIES